MNFFKMPNTCFLKERIVGTASDDFFCSLLFDQKNNTVRVIDFKTQRFQAKQDYLAGVFAKEGVRKIFTIVERSEVGGWKSIGYRKEGSIPAYYNQTDAYIMSCYNDGYLESEPIEFISESNDILCKVETLAGKNKTQRKSTLKTEEIAKLEAIEIIARELKRLEIKNGRKVNSPNEWEQPVNSPIFSQFSREAEHLFFGIENPRTKQANVLGVEYQGFYRNAKVEIYFPPMTTTDMNLARNVLDEVVQILREMEVACVFSPALENAPMLNAVYLSSGFVNTGRLLSHRLDDKEPKNMLMWAKRFGRNSRNHV